MHRNNSDPRFQFQLPGETHQLIWENIRFVSFGRNIGRLYIGWDFPGSKKGICDFFKTIMCLQGLEKADRFKASTIGSVMTNTHLLERLMLGRRIVFTNKFDGAPFGPLVHRLASAPFPLRNRLVLALFVQVFGVRNIQPCNCCEARYKIHANDVSGTRIQVMYPFFDCISLNIDKTFMVVNGCCGNCMWLGSDGYCVYHEDQPSEVKAFARRYRTSIEFEDGPRGLLSPTQPQRTILEPSMLSFSRLEQPVAWNWSNAQERHRAEFGKTFGNSTRIASPWQDWAPNR
ncbi:hypothetical protein C8A00DRAFT_38473 [Chaetomidium leptoderma]|uniref:Uncharacterized protein n=1 Tax=Chaetomidium leptoderma TaxID=669021 RepID=A0AAN6ZST9_9PEZI|nr:hypothetical protein C8A00DRAFT_38473 [Chaetomidium leptoderma]